MITGHRSWRRGERACAAVFSVTMLVAVLSPLLQYRRPLPDRVDGFPLSWYPMFSARRRRRVSIAHAIGVTATGTRRAMPVAVYGSGGLNQARRQLNRMVLREGRPDVYAAKLAARVARRPDCTDIVRVQVLTTRFDLDRCFLDRVANGEETVLATVEVSRGRVRTARSGTRR